MPIHPQLTIVVDVDGDISTLLSSTTTSWVDDQDFANPIGVWVASRYVGSELQVEYELSCKVHLTVTQVTITVGGVLEETIDVNRDWPSGRVICGRIGPEMEIDPLWDPTEAGPLDMRLPDISDSAAVASTFTTRLATLRACIASGRAGLSTANCEFEDSQDGINPGGISPWEGPFACWGSRDGGIGAPGGNGIFHPWGWQNCVEYARFACEVEAVAMTRMWVCVKTNGAHASVDDYAPGAAPYVDDNSMDRLSGWDSGTDLLMHPQQTSHLVRVMRYVGAAWEMTRSPMAKRHLIQLAEMARLMWSERGAIVDVPGSFIARNFATYEWMVYHEHNGTARPIHTGTFTGMKDVALDRSQGWVMYAAAMAKKAGMTLSSGWIDWSSRYIAAFTYSQMPNGLFSRSCMPDWATTADPTGHPATADISAAMHEAIIGIGFAALSYQTGASSLAATVAHATALYNNPNANMIKYYNGQYGPWHWVKTGTNDGVNYASPGTPSSSVSVDATCSFGYDAMDLTNPGDPAHSETEIAVAYKLTGDYTWAERGLLFGFQYASIPLKLAAMEANLSLDGPTVIDRNWQAWLMALYQHPPAGPPTSDPVVIAASSISASKVGPRKAKSTKARAIQ
jgi:hypothetical protein